MAALIGLDLAQAGEIAAAAQTGPEGETEVCSTANDNAPGQIVISGDKSACKRAVKIIEIAGLRSAVLAVAGAFHSPIMQSAAERMREELAKTKISAPTTTIYSNVTAQPHTDPESIKRLLVEQIVSPVRWAQTMATLVATGDARYIELTPGRTLAGLIKRINRRLPVEENAGIKGSA